MVPRAHSAAHKVVTMGTGEYFDVVQKEPTIEWHIVNRHGKKKGVRGHGGTGMPHDIGEHPYSLAASFDG